MPSLDGQTLQKLLSSLNQNPSNAPSFQGLAQPGQAPQDLAALLSNVARQSSQPQPQHQQPTGYQQSPATPSQGYPPYQGGQPQQQPQQAYPAQLSPTSATSFANNPAFARLLNRTQQGSPTPGGPQYQSMQPQQPPPQQPQNVQDIMAQLAKYGR